MRFLRVNSGESLDQVVERLLPQRPATEQRPLREALLAANPQLSREAKHLDAAVLVVPETASGLAAGETPGAAAAAFFEQVRTQIGDLQRPLDALLARPEQELKEQRELLADPEVQAAARKQPQLAPALAATAKQVEARKAALKATRERLQGALREFDHDLTAMFNRLR
jgi:hypothetical protein